MTVTVAENQNRDIYLDSSRNIALFVSARAIAQLTKSRVEAQRGEMKYAANQGLPARQTAWDVFNPKQFEAAVRSIILSTPDVTGIQSFALIKDGNKLQYTAVIETIYGTASL